MKQICTKCVYDNENTPGITFDEKGVCNYCEQVEEMLRLHKTGSKQGEAKMFEIAEKIKLAGKGKKYDCIIGVSGGADSSYLCHLAVKKYGLRPLAVHFDNTFNSSIATENIRKVLQKLNIDLHTHVIDNKEAADIYRSFFKASVRDFDVLLDIGIPELLYRVTKKYGLKYMLEGHSLSAEGISPLSTMYFDGKYLKSVHKKFGKVPLKTFPVMTLFNFLKWTALFRIEKVRPLWYVDYSKEDAIAFLEKEYDWVYYKGHHLECRSTSFQHSVLCPQKFKLDNRANSLSGSVRSGKMSREAALDELKKTPHIENDLVEYMCKRMELTQSEYDEIMSLPLKTYRDYPTYKRTFERLQPLFKILVKRKLVPESFYMKYCFPNNDIF
jgi:N-acetyl sugar amidotransferase